MKLFFIGKGGVGKVLDRRNSWILIILFVERNIIWLGMVNGIVWLMICYVLEELGCFLFEGYWFYYK